MNFDFQSPFLRLRLPKSISTRLHISSVSSVLVALSGGLDSAAVVLMLRERGLKVQGLYIDMLGSSDGIKGAQDVADVLGIELHVRSVTTDFKSLVVDYLLHAHAAGETPSPCARCNPLIKWGVLRRTADELGIQYIATGHYVRIVHSPQPQLFGDACHYIEAGIDPVKDQSYYLWALDPSVLSRAITPLGDYTKVQVRAYLAEHGFEPLARSRESMSLCFLKHHGHTISYTDFLKLHLPVTPGPLVDIANPTVPIGTHQGYQLYTIGQKRGFTLSVDLGPNLDHQVQHAVCAVDAHANIVYVTSDPQKLYSSVILVRDFVIHNASLDCTFPLTSGDAIASLFERVSLKVRGLGRNPEGYIIKVRVLPEPHTEPYSNSNSSSNSSSNPNPTLELTLSHPAWAVAPGQPVVFYLGERVLGGGFAL